MKYNVYKFSLKVWGFMPFCAKIVQISYSPVNRLLTFYVFTKPPVIKVRACECSILAAYSHKLISRILLQNSLQYCNNTGEQYSTIYPLYVIYHQIAFKSVLSAYKRPARADEKPLSITTATTIGQISYWTKPLFKYLIIYKSREGD